MKLLIALAVITAAIALYVVWLRPKMRKTRWGARFLDWIEPMERVLWWKSETILWARLKIALGIILSALAQAGTINLTPFLPFVPEKYQGVANALIGFLPMLISLDGTIGERLRRDTTKPLVIVAMRTDAPEEVKAAAADAEAVTRDAVAAAVEAKAV